MPNYRLTSKGRVGGRFGGKLICFCKQQLTTYSIPEEVCCANFTGEMLQNWKRVYKMSKAKPVNSQTTVTPHNDDLSTPSGLANYYKQLIEMFGFKSAAFALEVAKFWKDHQMVNC